MAGYLAVRNWRQWQTYRKGREALPPWIKVYRRLLQDGDFVMLTDAERGQLLGLWLLAADRDGRVPNDVKMVSKMTHSDADIDLKKFVESGFLEPPEEGEIDSPATNGQPLGDNMAPPWRHDGDNMAPQRREEEIRGEETQSVYACAATREEANKTNGTEPGPDFRAIQSLWNEIVAHPKCLDVHRWSAERFEAIRRQWNGDVIGSDLGVWRTVFEAVKEAPFLVGGGDKKWRANIDWVMDDANLAKLEEGNYTP